MKVHALISKLSEMDQESRVYIPCPHCCFKSPRDLLLDSEVQQQPGFVFLGDMKGECLEDKHDDRGSFSRHCR